jgi:hypothetical protein
VYFQKIYRKVVYLDPDIIVFKPLNLVFNRLDSSEIVLIPHQNNPSNKDLKFGIEAEITSLQYGVFNLGFVAVNNKSSAVKFANWWAERLDEYCFDDRARGLFTDQKWCDLAPALFEGVYVERSPGYDSAPWNSHCYDINIEYGSGRVVVDDKKGELVFFHFSGLDSGEGLKASTSMNSFGRVHRELYVWYIRLTDDIAKTMEQFITKWTFGFFSDGSPVTVAHRSVCKKLLDLKVNIGDPYSQSGRYYIEALIKKAKSNEPNK